MDAGATTVQIVNPLDHLKVAGFTVTDDLPTADPGSISNDQPTWQLADAMRFFYTRGTEIDDIKILNSPSEGLTMRSTYEANVNNVTIIGATNKDAGGNGYGLNLAGSQYSNYNNITILDTRHAVLFSAWATEVGNNVHVLATNRDVNYHGGPDHANTVVVDQDILGYQGNSTTGFSIVSSGGPSQPFTDVDANTTQFSYAIGNVKIDVIHGARWRRLSIRRRRRRLPVWRQRQRRADRRPGQ